MRQIQLAVIRYYKWRQSNSQNASESLAAGASLYTQLWETMALSRHLAGFRGKDVFKGAEGQAPNGPMATNNGYYGC